MAFQLVLSPPGNRSSLAQGLAKSRWNGKIPLFFAHPSPRAGKFEPYMDRTVLLN